MKPKNSKMNIPYVHCACSLPSALKHAINKKQMAPTYGLYRKRPGEWYRGWNACCSRKYVAGKGNKLAPIEGTSPQDEIAVTRGLALLKNRLRIRGLSFTVDETVFSKSNIKLNGIYP
ncbi:hypothetical protein M514_24811 [Trichuris suis]|uniref:Uncharacterized protein n=1 Tax=Trichuris suis TaxID=68888 RepID=A0A085N0P8_9BILA|nr:hypothetical protein M514_24811 [Trichuris suis]